VSATAASVVTRAALVGGVALVAAGYAAVAVACRDYGRSPPGWPADVRAYRYRASSPAAIGAGKCERNVNASGEGP
jgi:hypothetical protein